MIKKTANKILCACNITRPVAEHLIGKKHTVYHRMAIGAVIMVAGVCVSKVALVDIPMVHYAKDVIGYAIHGIGCIPFIEYLTNTTLAITAPATVEESTEVIDSIVDNNEEEVEA